MISFRPQKPRWRSAQETVRRASPTRTPGAAAPASAGRNELSDLAFTLAAGLGSLRLDRAAERRREDGEGDEREEPRDVEVEPMCQDELEADRESRRERR